MEAHVCHIHATSKIRVDRAGWSRSIGGVAGSASIPAGVSPSYTPAVSLCAGAGTIETGLQRRVCELLVPKRWSPNCRSALTRDRQCPRGPSRDLARQMADTRTMLTASWSLQRANHGEQRDAGDRRVEATRCGPVVVPRLDELRHAAQGQCFARAIAPLGFGHHLRLTAAVAGTDEPPAPLGNGGVGAVPRGHLGQDQARSDGRMLCTTR